MDPEFKMKKYVSTRPYPVPIWHMDPEIKMQKHVSNRILSGFYKAVINLQIIKEPDTNRIKISKVPGENHEEAR